MRHVTAIELRSQLARAGWWNQAMTAFLRSALAVVILSACGGGASSQARPGRAVVSQHNGGTIRVTPSFSPNGVWRAGVQVWPKDVSPRTHAGIALYFTETASSESAIVTAATSFARSYIDSLTRSRDADAATAPPLRAGRTVMSKHNGWTMRITPAAAPDGRVWQAGVEVWPPDRDPESHSGIQMHFAEMAPDEKSIVESAMRSARRYIDASRTQHQ